MNDEQQQELASLKNTQKELRLRLEALDRRIEKFSQSTELSARIQSAPRIDLPPAQPPATPPVLPIAPIFKAEPFKPSPPPLPTVAPSQADPKAPEPTGDSLELRLGRVWLVRLGIVILLTGLVFLGNFAWQEFVGKLGPLGKLILICLAGGALSSAGWFLKRKKEELNRYGSVLIGGGIATVYYATYAAHFVSALRVIESPLVGGTLLLALAGAILWLSDRIRSQAAASATVILGFYTSAINPIGSFSLFSNLLLAIVAIILLLRQRWTTVSFLALAGSYLAFAFWRFHATGLVGALVVDDVGLFWTALLFPACYWVVFTVATMLDRAGALSPVERPVFLTVNNGAFFALSAPLVAGTHPDRLWLFTVIYGAVLIGLAALSARIHSREKATDGSYLSQGLALLSLGFLFKFSGYQLALIFAFQTAALLRLSRFRQRIIFQIFSGISAVVASGYALADLLNDAPRASLTGVAVAVLMVGTAWLFKHQRALFTPPSFQWRATGYVALGTMLALAVIQSGEPTVFAFAVLGLAMTASLPVLRMPEVVLGGQFATAAAFLTWFARSFESYSKGAPYAIAALTALALVHWWARRDSAMPESCGKSFWTWFHSVALVVITLVWELVRFQDHSDRMPLVFACWGLGFLTYGFLSRIWPLAIAGQLFAGATAITIFPAMREHDSWGLTVAALVVFACQPLMASLLRRRLPESTEHHLLVYRFVVNAISVLIAIAIIKTYVPVEWEFVALISLAFALFLAAAAMQRQVILLYATAPFIVGAVEFLMKTAEHPLFLPDFAGIFLILAAQIIGKKRLADQPLFGLPVQCALAILGISALWVLTGRFAVSLHDGFLLTISWSLLAFLVLGAGFLLKERVYRIYGLVILASSVGRIFLVDVWELETIYRIFSFLILGIVLLALGFLYNHFATALRKWI